MSYIDQYGDHVPTTACTGLDCSVKGQGRRPRQTANLGGLCDRCLIPPPPPFRKRQGRLKRDKPSEVE